MAGNNIQVDRINDDQARVVLLLPASLLCCCICLIIYIMKIHSLALSVVVLAAGNSHAFVPQTPPSKATALQAQKGAHDWFGPAAAAAAGWAMAAQLAFAAPADSAYATMLPGELSSCLLVVV
jgi:hypothetical protein